MKKLCLAIFMFTVVNGFSQDTLSSTGLLREVTVTAAKEKVSPTMRFLKKQFFSTTEDILSRMQSVYLVRRGSYGQEPVIRGLNGGQINTTIDGMRVFGACTDKMDPATIYIEPVNLKNVQVSTSADKSLAGSSLGGTMNMQLYDPSYYPATKVDGNMYISGQSVASGINTGGDVTYASKNDAIRLSGVYKKQQDYRDENGAVVAHSGYEKLNASLSYKRRLSENATLKIDALTDDGWNIGYPALPMDAGYAAARIFAATYLRNLSKSWINNFQVKGYYNSVRHYMDDSHRSDIEMHMDMPGKSEVQGVIMQASTPRISNHILTAKAEWYRNAAVASMTMHEDHERSMYMLTLPNTNRNVVEVTVKDQWLIDSVNTIFFSTSANAAWINMYAGLGKAELEVFGQSNFNQARSAWSANGTWQRKLAKGWFSRFSIGRGERLPVNNELFGYYLFNRQDGYDYVGNSSLKNEWSINTEASLKYSSAYFESDVTLFYNNIHNYIIGNVISGAAPMTKGAFGVKQYSNNEAASLYGLEATAIFSPGCHFKIVHTSKWMRGQYQHGAALPMISPYRGVTSVGYFPGRFAFLLENEAAAPQYRYDKSYGEDFTNGYAVFNVKCDYSFSVRGSAIKLFSGVDNLFNKVYHDHLDWGNINRPGRNVVVGLQVKL